MNAAMKIYLWYDAIAKEYMTGRSSEVQPQPAEILYAFEVEHVALSKKIARNLNKIR